jgi:hypothetical protein
MIQKAECKHSLEFASEGDYLFRGNNQIMFRCKLCSVAIAGVIVKSMI